MKNVAKIFSKQQPGPGIVRVIYIHARPMRTRLQHGQRAGNKYDRLIEDELKWREAMQHGCHIKQAIYQLPLATTVVHPYNPAMDFSLALASGWQEEENSYSLIEK